MRRSKYVGFVAIGVGAVIIIGAAILPVSPSTQRLGPFKVDVRNDNCGPAGLAALRDRNEECGSAAKQRLLASTALGMVVVAVGMALFAGGDEPHRSRILVGPVTVKRRRWALRNPGSRRYTPG